LNTDYFHKIANGRKIKNTIHVMKCGEVQIEGTENLISHATEYYKELFGPTPGNQFHMNLDTWNDHEKLLEGGSEGGSLCYAGQQGSRARQYSCRVLSTLLGYCQK
jgi:hypothetical protein